MKSPRGFFRPPSLGTFTIEPSTILRSACCTPSPDTSRVILTFSDFREILSTSSMYTMPRCVRSMSCIQREPGENGSC
jgi:hypothetical protein